MEKWNYMRPLAPGHITGAMGISELVKHKIFKANLLRAGVDEEGQKEMGEIVVRVTNERNIVNVSGLRAVLGENPESLGLDLENTRRLLVLFTDRQNAVDYGIKHRGQS